MPAFRGLLCKLHSRLEAVEMPRSARSQLHVARCVSFHTILFCVGVYPDRTANIMHRSSIDNAKKSTRLPVGQRAARNLTFSVINLTPTISWANRTDRLRKLPYHPTLWSRDHSRRTHVSDDLNFPPPSHRRWSSDQQPTPNILTTQITAPTLTYQGPLNPEQQTEKVKHEIVRSWTCSRRRASLRLNLVVVDSTKPKSIAPRARTTKPQPPQELTALFVKLPNGPRPLFKGPHPSPQPP